MSQGGNLSGFDATKVEPNSAPTAVPSGDYKVLIESSKTENTKANDGSWLIKFVLKIIDGKYKGQKIFYRVNIGNKNPAARKIAQGEISAICHAVGKMRVNDSAELHNMPFLVKVAAVPYQGSFTNEVKGVSSLSKAAANQPSTSPVAAGPAADDDSGYTEAMDDDNAPTEGMAAVPWDANPGSDDGE